MFSEDLGGHRHKRESQKCQGYNAFLKGLIGDLKGHKLIAIGFDSVAVVACMVCGAWAERSSVLLTKHARMAKPKRGELL